MKRKQKNRKRSFVLNSIEMRLLESVAYLEPYILGVIDKAKLKDGKYVIQVDDYDLDDIVGALFYEIQLEDTTYQRKEMLYNLYEIIKQGKTEG